MKKNIYNTDAWIFWNWTYKPGKVKYLETTKFEFFVLHIWVCERMILLLMCRLFIVSVRLWSCVVVNVVVLAIVEIICSTF